MCFTSLRAGAWDGWGTKAVLERWHKASPRVRILLADLTAGSGQTDWEAPIARQFAIPGIPYFILYSGDGRRLAEGEEARQQINRMLDEKGIKPIRYYPAVGSY